MVRAAQPVPAQFTTDQRGARPTAVSTALTMSSVLVTSTVTNVASSSFASASPLSALMSAMTTRTPFWASKRAVAAPSPEAPPVTTAEVPLSSMGRQPSDRRPFQCHPAAVVTAYRGFGHPGGELLLG